MKMNKATINILFAWFVPILLFFLFAVLGDYVRSLIGGANTDMGGPMPSRSRGVMVQLILVCSVVGILYVFGAVQAVLGFVRAKRTQKLWVLPPILFCLTVFAASIVVNPITNVAIGSTIDRHHALRLAKQCTGVSQESLLSRLGTPDDIRTNDIGILLTYRNRARFFTMFRENVVVVVRNGIVKSVYLSDD